MGGYIPDDGPDTGATRRTFVDRYNAIYGNFPKVDGLVDFGSYNGRLARQLAGAAGIPGVAIDDYEGLLGDKYVTAINKTVSARELGKIIREQDGNTAVIALSVFHHLPDWEKYAGVIKRNAKHLFIETAHPDEVLPEAGAHDQSQRILDWIKREGGELLHESPGWDSRYLRKLFVIHF